MDFLFAMALLKWNNPVKKIIKKNEGTMFSYTGTVLLLNVSILVL